MTDKILIDRAVVEQALEFIKATNESSSFWRVPGSKLNKTVAALRYALSEEALQRLTDVQQEMEQPQQERDPAARNGWVLREVLFDNGEPVGHREPQQKPVAWMLECHTMTGDTTWKLSWSRSGAGVCNRLQGAEHEKPLYTHPAPRTEQPRLTEQEVGAIMEESNAYGTRLYEFARAIEDRIRSKT